MQQQWRTLQPCSCCAYTVLYMSAYTGLTYLLSSLVTIQMGSGTVYAYRWRIGERSHHRHYIFCVTELEYIVRSHAPIHVLRKTIYGM